ncbi:hypothetical protein BGX24_010084 [Mortierella sp. AD032]|nr:hypothetical protein BGX24_010084 [Mortierella sp. AD032]
MPSTPFSSFKRRVVTFFSSSANSYATNSTKQQQSTNIIGNKSPSDVPTYHPPKGFKMRFKNLRLPWTKKKRSSKSSLDIAALFQDLPPPAVTQEMDTSGSRPAAIFFQPHYYRQPALSHRSSGITVGTDNHSLMDAQSMFSDPCTPQSPIFRYRMHYGPRIENIENMGEVCQADSHLPQDEYIQELDKEMAQASIRVMKRRQRKQLRLRLSIDGARPGGSGCGSVVSSTPSTPVSVTARGTYGSTGMPSSPASPTSARSFLSSKSLKSPTFQQRFSSRVAPSPSAPASPPSHASPKPPPPSRLTSAADLKDPQGPIVLTKEHIEYIRRIESRLRVLENSVPRPVSKECEKKLQQKKLRPPQPPKQQQHQRATFTDSSPTSDGITSHNQQQQQQQQQQQPRTKQSMVRRVAAGYIDLRTSSMHKRMSKDVDKIASRWSYPAATRAISLSSRRASSSSSPAAALVATAKSSRRNSSHMLYIDGDDANQTTDRTDFLLEQAKEQVASRTRMEASLWETETLLRQYDTLVVQDWRLKLNRLRERCHPYFYHSGPAREGAGPTGTSTIIDEW